MFLFGKLIFIKIISFLLQTFQLIFSKTKRQKIKVRVHSDRIQRSPKEYTFIFNLSRVVIKKFNLKIKRELKRRDTVLETTNYCIKCF